MRKTVALRRACTALAAATLALTAWAQPLPHAVVASPDIYKIAAENDQYRIIVVTWKPGQRDAMHSHASSGVYFLTDCALRYFSPEGGSRDGQLKAGHSVVQHPIFGHSVQNIGSSDCRLIMFEPRLP
jgi:beta-alanine degradation protein BauB